VKWIIIYDMKIRVTLKSRIIYIISFMALVFLFQACVEEKGACIGFNSTTNITQCYDEFAKHDCAKLNEDRGEFNWTFYPYDTCNQHDVTVIQAFRSVLEKSQQKG